MEFPYQIYCLFIGVAGLILLYFALYLGGYNFNVSYGRGQIENDGLKRIMTVHPKKNLKIVGNFDLNWNNNKDLENWLIQISNNSKIQTQIIIDNFNEPQYKMIVRKMLESQNVRVAKVAEKISTHYIILDDISGNIKEDHPDNQFPSGIDFVRFLNRKARNKFDETYNNLLNESLNVKLTDFDQIFGK